MSIKPIERIFQISKSTSSTTILPLTPPPFPKALESYLYTTETSHKRRDSNQISSEQCYQLSKATDRNSCYELPACDFYSPDSSGAKVKYDESIYGSVHRDLVAHKKKLAALKSLENVNRETPEEGELKEEYSESTFKEKFPTRIGLKRSRSVSNLDVADGEFTPKRRAWEGTRYASTLESPSTDSLRLQKSLPFETEPSSESPFSRRKSYPSSASIVPYRRSKTDQTPYTSPLHKRLRPSSSLYDASPLQALESESGFVDSHCHLDFLFDRQGYRGTYAEYREKQGFPRCYKGCLAVFCNPATFSRPYKWRHFLEEENVWAAFGCHPHNTEDYNDEVEKSLCTALKHSKVRALGEIGLDYSNRNNCKKDQQYGVFRRQLRIALQKQLPVVIHCREAHEDGISIIQEILPLDYSIHLHCFTDTWEACGKWLSVFPNLCVGLTNVLSFPSAVGVREVAAQLPLDRLLLETDTPYFVPRATTVPRGTRHSHPGMAIHVAAQVAAIKGVPLEQVLHAARCNTKRIYNI